MNKLPQLTVIGALLPNIIGCAGTQVTKDVHELLSQNTLVIDKSPHTQYVQHIGTGQIIIKPTREDGREPVLLGSINITHNINPQREQVLADNFNDDEGGICTYKAFQDDLLQHIPDDYPPYQVNYKIWDQEVSRSFSGSQFNEAIKACLKK